jgi:hypothetical protein
VQSTERRQKNTIFGTQEMAPLAEAAVMMAVPHYAPSMVDSRHVYAREKYLASMNNIIQ